MDFVFDKTQFFKNDFSRGNLEMLQWNYSAYDYLQEEIVLEELFCRIQNPFISLNLLTIIDASVKF